MKWEYKVDHQIRDLKEVYQLAEELVHKYGPYRFAVAVGDDTNTLDGLAYGRERGLVDPILVGHRRHILEAFEKLNIKPQGWHIKTEKDQIEATKKSAQLVISGKAEALIRGKLLARDFFKALLDPRLELKKPGALWSNIVVVKPTNINRLLFLTDCAVVVNTDIAGRLKMIQSALDFAAFLGVKEPKVALLAAVETVTVGMPVSLEEAAIAKMSERGQFPKGIHIDGPLSLDLAINPEAVKKKKINSPVAGQADILVLNNIGIGNLLFKSLITLCGASSASAIVGLPFPTVLTSRSESPDNILYSLALAILMAGPKK